MPATAGRVRMPANNRVHSSAALQTHGIWQSAIGYDPYAPTNKDDSKKSATQKAASSADPEAENAYASFQELLALAKITNSNSDETRGACKRCGRVGHLYVNCRNFLSAKDDRMKGGKDDDLIQELVLEKLKGEKVKRGESSEDDDEEEDSESSDSDYDSEMERIIAERAKKASGKVKVSSLRREDREEKDEGDRKEKRGRSKKRRDGKRENIDSEDEERRRKRKEKGRRKDDSGNESSDEEEERRRRGRKRKSRKERRRRRSHRHSSDSDSSEASPDDSGGRRHKMRSRKRTSTSDSDASGSDDPRVGRDKKRSGKKSRKSRHEERTRYGTSGIMALLE